ncbi:hypothetical protein Syun_031989 [Stephania yunnanensis]|uniref:Uncharacterized protein n=1 Tax=Stephania yunnanensis TaxID=152371 RepID=A0AAP0DWQ4_9MAGN
MIIENVKYLIGSVSGTWNVREIQMLELQYDNEKVLCVAPSFCVTEEPHPNPSPAHLIAHLIKYTLNSDESTEESESDPDRETSMKCGGENPILPHPPLDSDSIRKGPKKRRMLNSLLKKGLVLGLGGFARILVGGALTSTRDNRDDPDPQPPVFILHWNTQTLIKDLSEMEIAGWVGPTKKGMGVPGLGRVKSRLATSKKTTAHRNRSDPGNKASLPHPPLLFQESKNTLAHDHAFNGSILSPSGNLGSKPSALDTRCSFFSLILSPRASELEY